VATGSKKRRNIVTEILSRAERLGANGQTSGFGKRSYVLTETLRYLERAETPDWVREECLRHFPVALIAALEGALRLAIRDLIDTGSPFIHR
jgi:hypothetical protein